jgi:uncharacterized protein (DUF3820 family)
MDLGILTIQKLKEFALNRNGYFRHDLKQFGIKRKLNEKDILHIFEQLDINVNIIVSSEKNEDNFMSNQIVDFGKYKGFIWSNVPLRYLEWLWSVNENKFAYEEIKRRKNAPLDIENIAIGIGKYKGQKWINVPTDYLEWILTRFDTEHETYKFAKTVLTQGIDSD